MISGSVHKECIVSEFVSLITSQKYSKSVDWTKIDKSTVIMGDLNTPL